MIVCVCNNISERNIVQAVNSGMSTMRELRENLGVATCCGKCHTCAKNVLRECLDNNVPTANRHLHAMVFQAMPSTATAA
ncbi:(2Fe-2S)-binding protein [Glaciimonas immobilis]|uniref:Bacterioferritin-associated ferredoxin n=1 Tax=Glaciimonas immobilis TaxID=728004 RepID=A0A840RWL1_9BURK|nr:(2Fe-2S)-binding protein [Glaciimonas immobilis]KAF3998627.1 regulatory or redox protein complexing with Bfr, in iron storage and mobility [Glaciimonas immobilis]MBB5201488.1 bacterioferritin-associated ferredoxin [Glaciimonas immobilis]